MSDAQGLINSICEDAIRTGVIRQGSNMHRRVEQLSESVARMIAVVCVERLLTDICHSVMKKHQMAHDVETLKVLTGNICLRLQEMGLPSELVAMKIIRQYYSIARTRIQSVMDQGIE